MGGPPDHALAGAIADEPVSPNATVLQLVPHTSESNLDHSSGIAPRIKSMVCWFSVGPVSDCLIYINQEMILPLSFVSTLNWHKVELLWSRILIPSVKLND